MRMTKFIFYLFILINFYSMEINAKAEHKRTSNRRRKSSRDLTGQLPIPSKNHKTIESKFMYFKKLLIGSGSFGKVLYGLDVDRFTEYALKFEKSTVKRSVLGMELSMYRKLEGGVGIPTIYWYGELKNYKIMIMDLLGPSIDKYFKICNKKFSLKTTLMIGVQMFKRIEHVHSKNIVHRDIKPNNFLIGKFNSQFLDNTIYIIDFGLSKYFVEEGKHVPFKDDAKFVGTPRYASLNAHLGNRQSRRDDLESIFYLIVYFVKGELPWQGIRGKTKSEKKEKIKMKKKETSIIELCKGLPGEFHEIFLYIRSLKYEEKPNYDLIINLLNSVASKNSIVFNYDWDWNQFFTKSQDKNTNAKKEFTKLYKGYPNAKYSRYLKSFENLSNNDLNFLDIEMGLERLNSGNEKCDDINFLFNKINEKETEPELNKNDNS